MLKGQQLVAEMSKAKPWGITVTASLHPVTSVMKPGREDTQIQY